MVRLPIILKRLPREHVNKICKRNASKYLNRDRSSKVIRQHFFDYFVNEHSHNFVRSSPVIPYCDPTVAFVNAGMNQFKGVFLGTQTPTYRKVANSQKCVRVGGKHNDVGVVGTDGYHHTFFEMLGSWSFGDYFKREACKLAWDLLIRKYKINKGLLYVTYFKGDSNLNLEPDLECHDIWRSLGVAEERILPFGVTDNFWEMGPTGPCGPCTEIHVDRHGPVNRAKFVNKGLPDLTELWNIVFIQYNRKSDGTIHPLPEKHVDTGLGLERLVALLQGKISNYDTDLFAYLFSAIQKMCRGVPAYGGKFGEKDWNNMDTSFRMLADHTRMIIVCLADGVIPEQNQKLRRVMRKAFQISETSFKRETGLLKELSNYVVENLGCVYPELEANVSQVHQIIDYEEEVYRSLRSTSASEWEKIVESEPRLKSLDIIEMPGLVAAYKEIQTLPNNAVDPSFAFKLYDTYGLEEETIAKVSKALELSFDKTDLRGELDKAKTKSREQASANEAHIYDKLAKEGVAKTDDSAKYRYARAGDDYVFEKVEAEVLKVVVNNEFGAEIPQNVECALVLDKSNLYSEAGGQSSDKGSIKFKDNRVFVIEDARNLNGYVLHYGALRSSDKQPVPCNARGTLEVDSKVRCSNMKNHTATHLLNATLKRLKGATSQKSSKVTPKYLNFDVGVFGSKLTVNEVRQIEKDVNDVIEADVKVDVSEVNSQQLLSMSNVTLIPGEVYPDNNIRLIQISGPDDFESREPCCGTHVLRTGDIEKFCIVGLKSLGRSTTSLHGVTGERAKLARKNGDELLENIAALQKSFSDNVDKPQVLDMAVLNLRQNLKYDLNGDTIMPVAVKSRCSEMLNNIYKQIKDISRGTLKEFIEVEMQNVIKTNQNKTKTDRSYIVHYLACSTMLDIVPLHKATRLCHNIPVIVIAYSDSTVRARCCVPQNAKSAKFTAEKWLNETVGATFKSTAMPAKGQDASLICVMKGKKINIKDWDTLLRQSIELAKNYAEENL